MCTLMRECFCFGEVCGEMLMRFSFDVGREAPAVAAMFVPVMEVIAGFLPENQSPELWLMGRLLDLRLGIVGLLLPSKP